MVLAELNNSPDKKLITVGSADHALIDRFLPRGDDLDSEVERS